MKQVNPSDGVTSVGINAAITVEFSEPMNVSTVNSSTFGLTAVAGAGVVINGRVEQVSSTVFTFIPDGLLLPNTEHQVEVESTVKDTAGNSMAATFFSTFTTAAGMDNFQPKVEGVNPTNGTTGVAVAGSVIITFSEPMDPLTLNTSTCNIKTANGTKVPATITLSAGNTIATLTPTAPLFAGSYYYLTVTTGVKDVAGNALINAFSSSFTTAIAPGSSNLPTSATVTINPGSLFANGAIATTVIISNINRNGTPVPNGTLIGVTAAPAFNQSSVGGVISGPSVGTSVDDRFILFATEGAEVTLYYTPPDLDWLIPAASASGVIQVAAVDQDTRPVSLIAQQTATLFRVGSATLTPATSSLPADGASQTSVDVIVRDNLGNLVPDGTEIGMTTDNVFVSGSAGGALLGGTTSPVDNRVQIFTTTGGQFSFTYQAPGALGTGYGKIQAVSVNSSGAPTGLISTVNINLTSH